MRPLRPLLAFAVLLCLTGCLPMLFNVPSARSDGTIAVGLCQGGAYRWALSDKNGDSQIFLTDARASFLRQLTQERGYCGWPSWSPDGRELLYVARILEPGAREPVFVLRVIDERGRNARTLLTSPRRLWFARWSGDGRSISVSVVDEKDEGQGGELRILDARSGATRVALRGGAAICNTHWVRGGLAVQTPLGLGVQAPAGPPGPAARLRLRRVLFGHVEPAGPDRLLVHARQAPTIAPAGVLALPRAGLSLAGTETGGLYRVGPGDRIRRIADRVIPMTPARLASPDRRRVALPRAEGDAGGVYRVSLWVASLTDETPAPRKVWKARGRGMVIPFWLGPTTLGIADAASSMEDVAQLRIAELVPPAGPADLEATVARLVPRLAAPAYADRVAAQRALVALGPGALRLLAPHRAHAEPEIRARLQTVIARIEGGSWRSLSDAIARRYETRFPDGHPKPKIR